VRRGRRLRRPGNGCAAAPAARRAVVFGGAFSCLSAGGVFVVGRFVLLASPRATAVIRGRRGVVRVAAIRRVRPGGARRAAGAAAPRRGNAPPPPPPHDALVGFGRALWSGRAGRWRRDGRVFCRDRRTPWVFDIQRQWFAGSVSGGRRGGVLRGATIVGTRQPPLRAESAPPHDSVGPRRRERGAGRGAGGGGGALPRRGAAAPRRAARVHRCARAVMLQRAIRGGGDESTSRREAKRDARTVKEDHPPCGQPAERVTKDDSTSGGGGGGAAVARSAEPPPPTDDARAARRAGRTSTRRAGST